MHPAIRRVPEPEAGRPHRQAMNASLSAEPWDTESLSSSARRAAKRRLRPWSTYSVPLETIVHTLRSPITGAPTHLVGAVHLAASAPTAARDPLRLPLRSPAQLSADWSAPLCVTPRRRPLANQKGPLRRRSGSKIFGEAAPPSWNRARRSCLDPQNQNSSDPKFLHVHL